MKRNVLEANFAMTLGYPEEADPDFNYYWTGWKRHWWPADAIRPGVRFYGFDTESRRFVALLEATKGGSFTYQSRKEFEKKVERLAGWTPLQEDPHLSRIPVGKPGKPCIGFTFRWKVIKGVNIPWPHRFHQLGWEKLTPANMDSPANIEGKIAEIVERGQGFHITTELRKKIEELAINEATKYFETLGYKVDNVGRNRSYDLECQKENDILKVEVKGTQTDGGSIILTPNEVSHAKKHVTALFVLHSIRCAKNGKSVTGGSMWSCWGRTKTTD